MDKDTTIVQLFLDSSKVRNIFAFFIILQDHNLRFSDYTIEKFNRYIGDNRAFKYDFIESVAILKNVANFTEFIYFVVNYIDLKYVKDANAYSTGLHQTLYNDFYNTFNISLIPRTKISTYANILKQATFDNLTKI